MTEASRIELIFVEEKWTYINSGVTFMPNRLATTHHWFDSLRIETFTDGVLYVCFCFTIVFYCHLKLGSSFYYANSKIRWLACMYCTMYTLPMPKFYIWLVEAQNLGVILKICLWSWVEQLLFPKGAICQKIKAYIIWVVCVCIIVQVYFSNNLLLV